MDLGDNGGADRAANELGVSSVGSATMGINRHAEGHAAGTGGD